jgi:hypothetical protein
MEIVKKKGEMSEIKSLVNQIKTRVANVITRQDQEEERLLWMEDKIKEMLHSNNNKVKNEKTTIPIFKNSGIWSKDKT